MASMDVPAGRPAATPATARAVARPVYIWWLTLAFMTTASVASLRSAPTMAVYGLTCVFLYLVPAVIFLLPQSLVAAGADPEHGFLVAAGRGGTGNRLDGLGPSEPARGRPLQCRSEPGQSSGQPARP